jgi:RHS repeat-associated protein
LYSETVYDANNRPVQKKSPFNAADPVYKTPSSTFIQYDPVGQAKAQSEPTFGSSGAQWTNLTYYGSGDIKTSTDPWQITTTYGYNQVGQQTNRTMTVPGDDANRTQAWGFYPDGALQSRSDTAAQQPVDVMDNADLWQSTLTGTWATVTGGTNTQGANYRTHAAAAVGTPEASDSFSWRVMPDVAGSFDVYASCPVRTDSTTAATYTINHSTGAATKTVDQKACTAANPWVNLGNYSFPGGVAKTVVLKPATSGLVVADALKLVSTNPVESRSFTYSYDANGQQTEVKDNNPNALADTFKVTTDGLARTTQVQELKSGAEKSKTDYAFDLNSNPLSTYAQRVADSNNPGVSRYTVYTWDIRNLVDTVKAGATPTSSLDMWQYTYDPRGLRSTVTKPNGNVSAQTYHEDGLPRTLVEKTGSQKLVSSHSLRYGLDGDRSQDVEKILQPDGTNYLDQASAYANTPAQKLASVTKTGVDKGDNESYGYDAAGNVTSQTIGATTSTMTYDRNRLVKTVSGATTQNQRYDAFGRSTTTDIGAQVVEQNAYDGYDRLVRQQKFDSAGTAQLTRNQTFDPFDRVSFQAEKVGTAQSVSTRYTFVGLADQVAIEEQKDTTGAYKVSKSYAYGTAGENLSLVDTPVNTSTSKKSFYGVNPHGDVETLTDATTGQTTSTYRYTAYGQADKIGTIGDDAITGNPYRFNSSRFDGATGTYDMGFRDYNPGLNRFLTRDAYAGALKDMSLGTDPWNTNRYAFGGGNPVSRVELDGHLNREESAGGGFVGASLELCGADCSLDFSDGVKVVDPSPGDSFNSAVNDVLLGAVQGVVESGEQASPFNPIRQVTGSADSQIYHGLVQSQGVNTDSTAYEAGRFFGPMFIPTGGAGVGVKIADRTAATLADKAAAKLADNSAKGGSGAESALAGRDLGRQLASEQQMGEVGIALAGAGSSTKLRVAERLTRDYGGVADDWAKVGSSSYRGADGFGMETHWYENVLSGERFEFKTKTMWLP